MTAKRRQKKASLISPQVLLLQVVDHHRQGESIGHLVHSAIATHHCGNVVGLDVEVERIHHEDGISTVARGQHPVLTLVHVDHHQISHVQVDPEKRVRHFSLEKHAEGVNGSPHEIVLIDVPLVVLQPRVESRGILVDADARKTDGCSRHQGTYLADSVGGGAQLFVLPLGVALVVLRIVTGQRQGEDQQEAEQLVHGYKTITNLTNSKSTNGSAGSPLFLFCSQSQHVIYRPLSCAEGGIGKRWGFMCCWTIGELSG